MVYVSAAVRVPGSNTSAQYAPLDDTVPVTVPPCCTDASDVAEQIESFSVPTPSPIVACGVNDVRVTVTVPPADADTVNVCELVVAGATVPENVSVVAAAGDVAELLHPVVRPMRSTSAASRVMKTLQTQRQVARVVGPSICYRKATDP
jgi:hypothetical protein